MTYTELQTNVVDYLHRSDLAAKMPGFIALAESMIFRELQVKELQVKASGTTTGGYASLPTDFGTLSRITITSNGSTRDLDYKSLTVAPTETSSYPDSYSFENDSLRIWGAGDGQAYTLFYIPDVQPLSVSVATNWLLENAYDLYFYASALEGAKHVRNQGETDKIGPMIQPLLDSVKRFSERRAQPMTGSLQIKPRSAWTSS